MNTRIKNKIEAAYLKSGQSAAILIALHNKIPFAYCSACQTDSPIDHNNCLICGNDVKGLPDITYHRNPTAFELKQGYGATHYKDFERGICWNNKTGRPKKWLVCPIDGLRYYY